MNLDRLREFSEIAAKGSVPAAAAGLNIKTQTLRARMNSFEESLGFSLFEKKGKESVALTPRGQQLYNRSRTLLKDYGTLKGDIRKMEELKVSSLTIGNIGQGLPFFLGPFLDGINRMYPHIRLEIVDDGRQSIMEGLMSGEVDVFFSPALPREWPESICRMLVTHNQAHVLLPSSHPLSESSALSLSKLDGERFLLYPRTKESCIRDFQLENLKLSGIRHTVYDNASSPLYYHLLVPVQKGILLYPTGILHVPPGTAAIPVSDIIEEAPTFLFYLKASRNPSVRFFVDGFLSFMREHKKKGGEGPGNGTPV